MPLALLSVSDKTGLIEFAQGLTRLGWELVSTGGTAKALRAAGLQVKDVSDLTGFPEMLDGRVKTLHPAVHGGLLARRDDPEHMSVARGARHYDRSISSPSISIRSRRRRRTQDVTPEEVIENIDIGGPSMLRSAAKNFESVTVVVDPADYARVLATLEANDDDIDLRRLLAEKVFAHTAAYDSAIATGSRASGTTIFPTVTFSHRPAQTLRYGENPGQRAAFYSSESGNGLAGLSRKAARSCRSTIFSIWRARCSRPIHSWRDMLRDREAHDSLRSRNGRDAARRLQESARVRSASLPSDR